MPHTQTHDGHERDTHTSRARREDTNKRRQSSNRSRTDLHIERERLPATPTYGRTTTETTRYRERASESSTKEPQAKQKAIKREQRRRLSKAGVASPRDIEKSVRE